MNIREYHIEIMTLPSISRRWCFTDGSWKENNIFSRQGWLSTLEGFDGMMEAKNVRGSLSFLCMRRWKRYSGNGMYEKLTSISG